MSKSNNILEKESLGAVKTLPKRNDRTKRQFSPGLKKEISSQGDNTPHPERKGNNTPKEKSLHEGRPLSSDKLVFVRFLTWLGDFLKAPAVLYVHTRSSN